MPYIRAGARGRLDPAVDELADRLRDMDAGAQNYAVTRLLVAWVQARGVSYETLSDAVKVLETAKLEFYRRWLGPYEDRKIEENGDVFPDL